MNLKTFTENFDLLADTPSGIPKLREMILQLAVRGKLVPQNPDDEPASLLLDKIKAEKDRLISEGKIKKPKPLPPIDPEEAPYGLPGGWEWTRVREATHDLGQKVPDSPFTYIDVTTINGELGLISESPRVLEPKEAPSRARKLVWTGSVIYSTVRPYLLNIAIVDREFTPQPIVSTAFAVLHPIKGLASRFLYYYLRSQPFIDYVNEQMTGMAYPAINDSRMSLGPLPFPPFAEQKRIVAKVDELMALCDELEARQKKRDEIRVTMNAACLHDLTSAEPKKSQKGWTRIRKNFDLLYDTPENVTAVHQSILQLAVMGRLVPQDPRDEPASVLLEKIAAERERLIAEGKIKRAKQVLPVDPDEVPYKLPKGWELVRLIQLCALITKGSSPKWQGVQYVDQCEGVLFITSENVGSMRMLMDNRKYVQKKFNDIEPRSILRKDDILMNIVGASIGRVAVFDLDEVANINQAVCLIRCIQPNRLTDLGYLLLFLNSAIGIGYMFSKQVDMARANLSMGNIAKFAIPLPPVAEQKRIVAKVGQLMALCDQLESKLQQSRSAGEKLMAAVVNQITILQGQGAVRPLPVIDSNKKRGETGSRMHTGKPPVSIDDLETEEVMAAFRKACKGREPMTREELLKEVSSLLGYQRLSSSIQERLKGYLRAAVRRKMIGTNGKEVWLEKPTMDDYDRTDLVGFLGSVMRWDKEYDREEVIRALANYLGFRRLTEGVQGPIKSAINSAIRRGNIVATGPTIRRIL